MPLALRNRDDPPSTREALPGLAIERETDAALMAAVQETTEDEIERRFAAGHRAYLAWWNGGPAAWGWIATRSAEIGELGSAFRIPGGERYLWNFVTLPAHRGKGIYPRLLDAIIQAEGAEAERFCVGALDLPVRSAEPVLALRPLPGDPGFQVETAAATYHAHQVVVATGPFQRPRVPALARGLDPGVVQLHSNEYRHPEQLPPGDVLVVGAGNSGVQIAAELAATRRTTLAVGERLLCLPERLLGRSPFWYLERSGMMRVGAQTRLGRKASRRELLIGQSPEHVARRCGVRLVGRAERADGGSVRFLDGAAAVPAAVLWATGFRSDYGWVRAPVLDELGLPIHHRGVTTVPGLYFLGLPWQHTRGSALIGWVGRDAAFLADRIAQRAAAIRGRGSTRGAAVVSHA